MLQPFTVLIVDDNELFRKDLAKFISRPQEMKVLAQAKDGHEAIALTESFRPDLVLMDISMPGMNGIEAARHIKEHFPKTKIVFVTIHEKEKYQDLIGSLAVDGFVCKSALKRELPKTIQQMKKKSHL